MAKLDLLEKKSIIGMIHTLPLPGTMEYGGDMQAVIDRALAIPATPLGLDDLKIIILMVYWGVGAEPDVLILDELCDDDTRRWSN